jgi:rubrerythrin
MNSTELTIEEAIKTALNYENKVEGVYRRAADQMKNAPSARVLEILANEEKSHVAYLQSRLDEWRKTGKLTPELLETAIPSKEQISAGVSKLKSHLKVSNREEELKILYRALEVETETSRFYEDMARKMKTAAKKMFTRFLEIENGHVAIVKAEIDAVEENGWWFDFREFSLEVEG